LFIGKGERIGYYFCVGVGKAERRGEESSLAERVHAELGETLQYRRTEQRRYHRCKLLHELEEMLVMAID